MPGMTPSAVPANRHAATILAWLGRRRLAEVHAALAGLRAGDPLLAAADALADAADSDDLTLRAAGLITMSVEQKAIVSHSGNSQEERV